MIRLSDLSSALGICLTKSNGVPSSKTVHVSKSTIWSYSSKFVKVSNFGQSIYVLTLNLNHSIVLSLMIDSLPRFLESKRILFDSKRRYLFLIHSSISSLLLQQECPSHFQTLILRLRPYSELKLPLISDFSFSMQRNFFL